MIVSLVSIGVALVTLVWLVIIPGLWLYIHGAERVQHAFATASTRHILVFVAMCAAFGWCLLDILRQF